MDAKPYPDTILIPYPRALLYRRDIAHVDINVTRYDDRHYSGRHRNRYVVEYTITYTRTTHPYTIRYTNTLADPG